MISARIKRTCRLGIASAVSLVKNAPLNAPTHMNPAWPRLSSPRIPTVRFKDTARITYMHSGTSRPFIRLVMWPVAIMICTTAQQAITRPYVRELSISFFFFMLSISRTYTFSLIFLPRIPVGRTRSTTIRTANTMASESWEEM